MTFELEPYWRNNFFVPCLILLFFTFWLLSFAWSLGSKLIKKEPITQESVIMIFMSIGIVYGMFSFSINTFRNGGIYLINEKEDDAITQTYIIDEISEPSELYPYFKHNHKFGADITMDGEIYFAVEAGDFKPGDTVTVTYLPKSKVILSIYYPEDSP